MRGLTDWIVKNFSDFPLTLCEWEVEPFRSCVGCLEKDILEGCPWPAKEWKVLEGNEVGVRQLGGDSRRCGALLSLLTEDVRCSPSPTPPHNPLC